MLILASSNDRRFTGHFIGQLYAHGKLETALQYDQLQILKVWDIDMPRTAEIQVCTVYVKDRTESCLAFIWESNMSKQMMGLVVFPNDVESMEYALTKFKERAQIL